MCVCVCVHAILIQYKTLQLIAFLLKKLSENIRENVTKSANYKSMEVLCFKLHSYKFVNYCGILYHESETSGHKYTTEVLILLSFSCFLTRCALCWFMYLNMLSYITNAC